MDTVVNVRPGAYVYTELQRDRKHGKSEAQAGNIDHSRANIRITKIPKAIKCVGKIVVKQLLFDTRF